MEKGICPYGEKCDFAHGTSDLSYDITKHPKVSYHQSKAWPQMVPTLVSSLTLIQNRSWAQTIRDPKSILTLIRPRPENDLNPKSTVTSNDLNLFSIEQSSVEVFLKVEHVSMVIDVAFLMFYQNEKI